MSAEGTSLHQGQPQNSRLDAIDLLRGIAALTVLIYHGIVLGSMAMPRCIFTWLHCAAAP
jgi:peptidoglycan/LPS O-acetylase OafA/YrhL